VTTDTSERGLERLISTALTGGPCEPGTRSAERVNERPSA
jgi:type I restriction enzyme, R subunit